MEKYLFEDKTTSLCNEIRSFCKNLNSDEKSRLLNEIESLCAWERKQKDKNMLIIDFLKIIHSGSRLYISVPYEAAGIAKSYCLEYDDTKRKYFIPDNKTVEEAIEIIQHIANKSELPEFAICLEFDKLVDATGTDTSYSLSKQGYHV